MALESKKYSLEYVVEEINFCCLLFFSHLSLLAAMSGGKTCRYETTECEQEIEKFPTFPAFFKNV